MIHLKLMPLSLGFILEALLEPFFDCPLKGNFRYEYADDEVRTLRKGFIITSILGILDSIVPPDTPHVVTHNSKITEFIASDSKIIMSEFIRAINRQLEVKIESIQLKDMSFDQLVDALSIAITANARDAFVMKR